MPLVCPEGTTPVDGECVADGVDAGVDGGSGNSDAGDSGTDGGRDAALDDSPIGEDACAGGVDVPDPMFLDSNCDGLDGDIANSVFVSSDAGAGGDGTREMPFQTIAEGIAAATAEHRDVLVAGGTYIETITLVPEVDVFGGYQATSWTRSATRTRVRGPDGAPALLAVDIDTPTRVVGFEMVSTMPSSPGQSSIAARVVRSDGLILEYVTLTAADGSRGDSPTQPVAAAAGMGGSGGNAGSFSGRTCPFVNPQPTPGAGAMGPCSGCRGGRGGVTEGYYAGSALRPPSAGENGPNNTTIFCTRDATIPGGAVGTGGAAGRRGATGTSGGDGAHVLTPTPAIGAFSESGYAPADGRVGPAGGPGVAGAGGGGGGGCFYMDDNFCFSSGGPGGGGGAGGCAGAAGLRGGGGGASIGLYLWDSTPTLTRVTISAGTGGRGGDGTRGGAGGAGGAGGDGGGRGPACGPSGMNSVGGPGGPGGAGGAGGSGSGGSGGPSIGVLLGAGSNQSASSSGVTITTSSGGVPGAGGTGAVNGENGLVQPTYTP